MIRKWEEKDITQITELLDQLEKDLKEETKILLETVREHYNKMRKNEVYESFVYEENKQVIGFISVVFYRSVLHRNGTALVNELIVDKKFRGKRIGKKLIDCVIKEALIMEMDEIEVGVMKENTDAIRFYKANGMDEEYYLLGKEFE
jgi:ribosomal protein S18 acetylase RimI-like enzyme